nr:PQQ-binding-like beta-propeller repeat protein [Deltaproteobacteria bacterium]
MNRRALALSALVSAGLVGCMPPIRTTTAFSSRFGDNNRGRLGEVAASAGAGALADRPRNSLGRPLLATVIQGEGRAVAVYDVQTGQALWSRPMAASSTPEILGDAVVVEVGSSTKVLDLATGAERGHVDHNGLEFAGADRDGDTIVMCFAAGLAGGSRRAGRVQAVDARSGSERWTHEVGGILGRPAAKGGLAFVPWDRQSIAVLDLATGVEQARLRSTDDVLSWVFASPQGVFYGGRGIYRLNADSASGTRAGSQFLANPFEGIPGDPLIHRDAFQPTTGTRTARDRIGFTFLPGAPAEGGRLTVHGDTIYASYYHDVLAVDAATGGVRWAVRLEEDVEAMELTPTGLFVVSASGHVRGIDPATGAVGVVSQLNAQVGAIAMDVGGLALPAERTAPEGSAREQLVSLIRDPDNRLVPLRSFLVTRLARLEDEEVTHDLLDLYTQRSIPVQLRQSIATALQSRRTGARFLVAALEEHFDYLENHSAPPLQVIAPTLVAMNAREAVPGLTAHLLDHETPMESLPDVINAIGALGEGSAVPVFQRWVQMYRSDSTFRGPERVVAMNTAIDAIFRHGDASARAWLQQLSEDTRANPLARAHVTELQQRDASDIQRRETQQTEAERQAALQAEINRLHELQATVPSSLTDAAFDEAWNAHLDEVRECAQGAVSRNPSLNQIRVVVTLRSELPRRLMEANPPARTAGADGVTHPTTSEEALTWTGSQMAALTAQRSRVRLATYAPADAELRSCMDRVVLPLEFPVFREMRQEFRRVIDTRAARAQGGGETINGLGLDAQGRELPWWLVSAPTLEVENPPPPVRPGTAPATVRPGTGPTTPTTPTTPGTPTTPTTPTVPGTPAQRPWWEE